MARHFLDDFVQAFDASGDYEEIVAEIGTPWYNPYGDSIHFLTEDAAYVGQRLSEVITIFRHYEDGRVIGFLFTGVSQAAGWVDLPSSS